MAKEVASFGIALTLVEPGPTRTGFGDNLVTAPALEAYGGTAAGEMRRAMADGQSAFVRDDPGWMVEAMIACAERDPAPRRLTLGSGSFDRIRTALLERLAALEAQEAVARGDV